MSYTIALALTILVPFLFGYIYGRNHVDPNTSEGKKYYNEA